MSCHVSVDYSLFQVPTLPKGHITLDHFSPTVCILYSLIQVTTHSLVLQAAPVLHYLDLLICIPQALLCP
jgi:hypothetical protein